MTSEAQINANRQNAQASTGPRTEEGKAASSRNALSLGLFTRNDYVKPEERQIYKEFCETMFAELTPVGLVEETLVAEITGASWRLRRCSCAEGDLADYAEQDPLLDEATEKKRRGIERARAAAHSTLHRSLNQLRKLQTERVTRQQLGVTADEAAALTESHKVCRALATQARLSKQKLRTVQMASNREAPSKRPFQPEASGDTDLDQMVEAYNEFNRAA